MVEIGKWKFLCWFSLQCRLSKAIVSLLIVAMIRVDTTVQPFEQLKFSP